MLVKCEQIFITPDDDRWYNIEDLPNEYWLKISFCNYMYISNYSRIKTLRYNKKQDCIKILKPWKNTHSYYMIKLTDKNNKQRKNYTVSRLMGEIFLNAHKNEEILHDIDVTENICDNRLCNLRVGTHSDNMQDCIKKNRYYTPFKYNIGLKHHKSKPVDCYDENNIFIKTYESMHLAEKELNLPYHSLSYACKHNKLLNGFKWKFHKKEGDE